MAVMDMTMANRKRSPSPTRRQETIDTSIDRCRANICRTITWTFAGILVVHTELTDLTG